MALLRHLPVSTHRAAVLVEALGQDPEEMVHRVEVLVNLAESQKKV
jgi:hypothetical protein